MVMQIEIAVPEKIRPVLIKQTEVLKMCGIKSVNTLAKRINESDFPQPLKIDGVKFWVYAEVHAWIQNRIAQAREAYEAERAHLADANAFTVK